jgi:hypothetical protein
MVASGHVAKLESAVGTDYRAFGGRCVAPDYLHYQIRIIVDSFAGKFALKGWGCSKAERSKA